MMTYSFGNNNNNDNNKSMRAGVTFCDLLAIVFITLKLLGVINWSWIWVLAPIWIPLALIFVLIAIMIIYAILDK